MVIYRIANVVTWLMLTPAANLSVSWTPVFGKPTNMSQSHLLSAGPDLLSAGPGSEKMWRPFTWGGIPIFFLEKNWRPFCLVITSVCRCQLPVLLENWRPFLLITLVHLGVAQYLGHAKNCRSFCGGPLFVGAADCQYNGMYCIFYYKQHVVVKTRHQIYISSENETADLNC